MHTIALNTITTQPELTNAAGVLAAVLLCLALALLYRALQPFRELIRALMAAGLAGALMFAALVLIVASTAVSM